MTGIDVGERLCVLRWRTMFAGGLEHAEIRESRDRVTIESTVIGMAEDIPFVLVYRLGCDAGWRVHEAHLSIPDRGSLHLHGNGRGRWFDDAGRPIDRLEGCVDLDISATPLTNTLPIRRLSLGIGERAGIRAAYVSIPELTVDTDEQRYERTASTTYRYEAVNGSFTSDIEVDGDGFVITYPGLFERELAWCRTQPS